jgi:DNA (cytosine-5)-methyltransferase 1
MNELALFAGAGGGLLASRWLLGHRIVCYVERDPYCVKIIKARIRDELLDDAPIWDDARTFDGRPWARCVDLVSAGFPCQPFTRNGKRLGSQDRRNLWPDTIRIIREVQPEWVFLENSTRLLTPFQKQGESAYISQILGDLAESGYVGRYDCLPASAFGFDHQRDRLWIVAHTRSQRRTRILHNNQDNSHKTHLPRKTPATLDNVWNRLSQLEQILGEPSVFGIDDGLANRVDQLKAPGNGQVPAVAAAAWRLLSQST